MNIPIKISFSSLNRVVIASLLFKNHTLLCVLRFYFFIKIMTLDTIVPLPLEYFIHSTAPTKRIQMLSLGLMIRKFDAVKSKLLFFMKKQKKSIQVQCDQQLRRKRNPRDYRARYERYMGTEGEISQRNELMLYVYAFDIKTNCRVFFFHPIGISDSFITFRYFKKNFWQEIYSLHISVQEICDVYFFSTYSNAYSIKCFQAIVEQFTTARST